MSAMSALHAENAQKLWDICDHITARSSDQAACIVFCNAAEVLRDVFGVAYWSDSSDYQLAKSSIE